MSIEERLNKYDDRLREVELTDRETSSDLKYIRELLEKVIIPKQNKLEEKLDVNIKNVNSRIDSLENKHTGCPVSDYGKRLGTLESDMNRIKIETDTVRFFMSKPKALRNFIIGVIITFIAGAAGAILGVIKLVEHLIGK